MSDPWLGMGGDLQSNGRATIAISPSDSVDLGTVAKAILVCADGNLALVPADNDDADVVTFTGVTSGMVIPLVTRRVMSTGTTATVVGVVR